MVDNVYLGNPNLKKANTAIEFTQEQILEFMKCKDDPVYFARSTGMQYNESAVEREIQKYPRIKGKEARLIKELLKGRKQ